MSAPGNAVAMIDPFRSDTRSRPTKDVEREPTCIACGYNLTGLISRRCPECGWQIDWTRARSDEESRRPGTPAYRANGWRIFDQTLWTVFTMLVAPWRFARDLRADEPIWPSLVIAIASCCIAFAPVGDSPSPADTASFVVATATIVAAILAVIAVQSTVFAALHRQRIHPRTNLRQRMRLWLLVSLYSTCFVSAWRFVNPPIADFWEPNFFTPWPRNVAFVRWESPTIGTTVIFYWWWLILATVLLVRNCPRWLALFCMPLVYLFAVAGRLAYQATGSLFDFLRS